MTHPQIGATIRVKPGLVAKPAISGREATIVQVVNDRLLVSIAGNPARERPMRSQLLKPPAMSL
jgi:hypothetical protein